MTRLGILACAAALLAGCGDDGGGDDDPIDAPPGAPDAPTPDADPNAPDADPNAPDAMPAPDAAPSTVLEVPCPPAGQIAVTVTSPGFNYAFDGTVGTTHTIGVADVVRFEMPASHNAVSGPPNQPDGLFATQFNETKCWRFTVAGTFPFHCTPHDFAAEIVVQ